VEVRIEGCGIDGYGTAVDGNVCGLHCQPSC
jgi:hypothetical protein